MVNKKGQAAMEYLMTYGWAILVIVIVLAALLYLGVFNIGTRTPDQCNFPVGVLCTSAKVTTTNIGMTLNNGLGAKMYVCQVVCDDSLADVTELEASSYGLGGAAGACTTNLAIIDVGQSKSLTQTGTCSDLTGTAVDLGAKYRGKLFLTYYLLGDSDSPRVTQGTMEAVIQPGT